MKKKLWSTEEKEKLCDLYDSGDKACLPWRMIPKLLNEEFGNNRTLAACQSKLYLDAAKKYT